MEKTQTTSSPAQPASQAVPLTPMAVLAPALGWLVPGAGHLIQKRWVRGLVLMAAIACMFGVGLGMGGKIYKPNTGDLLDMLGFIGDVGAGGLYFTGRIFGWGALAITSALSDYGTKYIVVAGLLNIMAIVDAYHIAIGKKQ